MNTYNIQLKKIDNDIITIKISNLYEFMTYRCYIIFDESIEQYFINFIPSNLSRKSLDYIANILLYHNIIEKKYCEEPPFKLVLTKNALISLL